MAPGPPAQPQFEWRGFSLKQIAVVAFIIGVLLHACVVLAVTGGGGDGGTDDGGVNIVPSSPSTAPSPTPTILPDRTSCDAIRGTDYRSEAERRWFQANCTTGSSFPVLPYRDIRVAFADAG
jgi:hypothetical protein